MAANIFELVCYNRYRQTRLVLEAGGDPNFRNEIGETPLMACSMFIRDHNRRTQLMRMLIGFGADVNAQNDKGQTLMMYACILDQGDTLLLLLDKVEVNLNLSDVSGNTSLMYACALERAALVYVLLDGYRSSRLSINVYHRNHEGHTAREIAVQRNFIHISDLFTDIVDKDYWSTYGELSTELDCPTQRTYPLKIDGEPGVVSNPAQPLAEMVERILHVSQEQPTTDDHDGAALTRLLDSADGNRVKIMTSGGSNLNSVSTTVENPAPACLKQQTNFDDLSRTNRKGRALSRTDSTRRRSFKSRQPNKDNGSPKPTNAGPSNQDTITNVSKDSFHDGNDETRNTYQCNETAFNIKITPESARSSVSKVSSHRRAQPQRVNYYTRHDIQDDPLDTNINVTEAQGEFTPRPPTRTKSRARRRKTTEVYVTVSDGKIVPYNPKEKQTDKKDTTSMPTDGNAHSPTSVNVSPSRPRPRRENQLNRASLARNSINTECGASLERSTSRSRHRGYDQNSLCDNVYKEKNIDGFDLGIYETSDMTYDFLIGKTNFDSALKNHISYNSHISTHDGKQNTHRKKSSFGHTPRKSASHRAVAW